MKENFITSMLMEGGKISHKRVISVAVALCLCFTIVWIVVKYKDLTLDTLHSSMLFILVMSGVATIAQIVQLVKGTPPPPEEPKQP
jgi:hypothetical protein